MKFSDLNKKGRKAPPEPPQEEPPRAQKPPPKRVIRQGEGSKSISFSQINAKPFLERQSEPAPAKTAGRSAQIPIRAPEPAPKKSVAGITAAGLHAERTDAHKCYGRAIHAMQAIISSIETHQLQVNDLLHEVITDLVRLIRSENHALLALTVRSTASNYLYAHTVNTAILALYVANSLDWDDEQMFILGTTALLHDIGMSQYLGLVQQHRSLTDAEAQEVRLHPAKSEQLIGHLKDIEESTRQLISQISAQVHERISGKGYPKGLKGTTDILQAAQIIGLCDTYEALSHYRTWRQPLIPHEALKQIIRQFTRDFDPKLIKAFMEQLSVFPPGSYVKLSSGEIGAVIKIHSRLLTRPVIEIKVQIDGNRQEPPIIMDLVDNPMIHAANAVDETKLNLKDKKLLLQFQAGRWWTE